MVATVLRDMTALLEQFESTHDRRAVFLDCYRRMTSAMVTELEEDRFDDARFVRTLLTRFAGYYFDAVDRWEHGDVSTPMPWQLALDATRDEHTDSPRLLLAGVNAHINHDLVLALLDVLDPEWRDTDHDHRDRRRADFDHVNRVIEATADEVQDHVLEARVPWMRVADVVMFRADEWMATQMLRRWRDDVWATAVVLLDDPDPARRAGPLAKRCAVCERRARRILAVGSGGP